MKSKQFNAHLAKFNGRSHKDTLDIDITGGGLGDARACIMNFSTFLAVTVTYNDADGHCQQACLKIPTKLGLAMDVQPEASVI